jgi:DNA-directed RNA polymerase subunit RPC12/RpoP
MRRRVEATFYECLDCKRATLLEDDGGEAACPVCESTHGRILTRTELKASMDAGAGFSIDLSSGHGKSRQR